MKKIIALYLKEHLSMPLVIVLCAFVNISCLPDLASQQKLVDKILYGSYKPCPKVLPENMSCVAGGRFILGSSFTNWKKENPELSSFVKHKVELSTFLIDKYEVTTEEYKTCVVEGKCKMVRSNYPHLRGYKQPQLKASWYEAQKYCKANGKRLPSEAEFEAASRGKKGEIYPWGNKKATCKTAIIKDATGRGCFGRKGRGKTKMVAHWYHTGATWEVGSRGPFRYGLYDMAGNAQEWVLDWFAKNLKRCGKFCLKRDAKGPCDAARKCKGFTKKLVKGGSWYWGALSARADARRPYWPKNKPPHHFGFRCVKEL